MARKREVLPPVPLGQGLQLDGGWPISWSSAMKANQSFVLLLLWPVLQVKRLLSLQLNLHWHGRRPRLVLEDPSRASATVPPTAAAKAGTPRAPAPAKPSAATPACEMHVELRGLLAQHRKARQLMRHLAYVERALRLDGAQALDKIPLEVLSKSLAQL